MPVTDLADLTALDATTLASLVRDRAVSAVEVVTAHLRRIDGENPALNAVVTLEREETVLAAARSVDASVREGRSLPLAGVPVVVKDNIATAGLRTTWGSRLLADHVPFRDATAVARLRAAGAVVVGKANTPEFANDIHTENRLFGPTLNPLDPARTPGGSSGGVAAAVRSGMAPVGLGTDYGGSIRWPAQCTGLVGMRPTAGLVPGTGQAPVTRWREGATNSLSFQSRLQTIGPLARTVEDLELVLRAVAGPDGVDFDAVPVQLKASGGVDAEGLRYGWMPGIGGRPTGEEVLAVLTGAVATLSRRVRVTSLDPAPLERAEAVFTRIRQIEGMADVRPFVEGRRHELSDRVRAALAEPPGSVSDYLDAVAERDYLRSRLMEMFHTVDVVLLPVSLVPAFPVATAHQGDERSYWQQVTPCRAISLFGLPAASVPVGRTPDGLPVSMQVVGRPFEDHEVLAAARLLADEAPVRSLSPDRRALAPRPPAA
jgi:amidase